MYLKKIIVSYSDYNHWANGRISRWLALTGRNIFHTETTASFRSIAGTLQHMADAQRHWLRIIAGLEMEPPRDVPPPDVDTITADLLSGSACVLDWVQGISEATAVETIDHDGIQASRYDFLMHMINHNTYHRGQIISLYRQLTRPRDIPSTDYDTYLWEKQNAGGGAVL